MADPTSSEQAEPSSGGPERVLRLTRRFEASPERVFDAWVRPELADKWLFRLPVDEAHTTDLDVRVGGKWRITARRGGMDCIGEGEYLVVERPRRLVFTFMMLQFSPNCDTITVEIEPSGTGCVLTLTQAGVDIAAELRQLPEGVTGGSEQGWGLMLDTLAAVAGEQAVHRG